MNLRALVPFTSRSNATRSEAGAFGTLHREIDRLFDDFTRGIRRNGHAGNEQSRAQHRRVRNR